jgi:F-type H+-transporting ATPase subunit delta
VKHAIIGHRYAQALLATVAQDDYPSLFSDVQYLCTALVEHPRLHSILSSRILHPEQRTQLLNALLEETMHREIWDNLFAILAKKAKMEIFPAILKDLEAKVLRAQGKQKFRLTLAHEQSDAVMQKIRTVVENTVHSEVLFDIAINPQVLGGFIAESDSLRIDGSIQNNLIKFKRQLLT